MNGDSSSGELGFHLLQQLELILDHDKLIDEVGFVHPTQFAALNQVSSSPLASTTNMGHSEDDILNKGMTELPVLQYDKTVFWNDNHKLAISTHALPLLYKAAVHAYIDANRRYKQPIKCSRKKDTCCDACCEGEYDAVIESEVLEHTRALLLLSYDFRSAWNSRKLVLSRKQELSLFMEEFQLSTLILSYAPKSENAWSQRQWAIKMIAGKVNDLQELVEKESLLVMNIAEKSKMNYRAWNYRCWLVLYMTKSQVLDELNKSRKWSELHVADNCCFHFRRRLMLRILEDDVIREGGKSHNCRIDVYAELKEELQWNKLLIQRYIGREALWLHRRFLSQCWIKHVACFCTTTAFDDFMSEELQLLDACINASADGFDDRQSQAKYAAFYILWILKQNCLLQEGILEKWINVTVDLKAIVTRNCPENMQLLERLLA